MRVCGIALELRDLLKNLFALVQFRIDRIGGLQLALVGVVLRGLISLLFLGANIIDILRQLCQLESRVGNGKLPAVEHGDAVLQAVLKSLHLRHVVVDLVAQRLDVDATVLRQIREDARRRLRRIADLYQVFNLLEFGRVQAKEVAVEFLKSFDCQIGEGRHELSGRLRRVIAVCLDECGKKLPDLIGQSG
jgi:hypothetical protein